MVVRPNVATAWTEWTDLLNACHDYAVLSGWRFVLNDFLNISQKRHELHGLNVARERALPVALDYGDRVRSCAEAIKAGAVPPRLVEEFQACQRLVSQEAVYNSMVATTAAIGLGFREDEASKDDGGAADDECDALAYQDMSQPIEVIARRLNAYHRQMRAAPGMLEERQTRLLHASFIVEFGLEHGLPEMRDVTSETTLTEFMTRLGEWEGAKRNGGDNELVRSLVLDALPDGPAKRSLRTVVLDWAYEHQTPAIIAGAVLGGLLGVAVAGLTVAAAKSVRRR